MVLSVLFHHGMDTTLAGYFKWVCEELGITWKKTLLLMGLGVILGLALALSVPLHIS
jgi:hypothetical protein